MIKEIKQQKEELAQLATSQQMAAADPQYSVWVEASAGTGKTKVLSDRVLRLLLAKVDPTKILCLTYTKAAAVEMNERIAKRLSVWAVENDEQLKIDLSKILGTDFKQFNCSELLSFARTLFAVLLDTPGGMKIQTIHSFCEDILKRFPLEAGISPYFEVLDDRSAREILQNIQSDLLSSDEEFSEPVLKNSLLFFTENVGEFRFPQVMSLITENRNKIDNLLKLYNYDVALIVSVLEKNLSVSASLSDSDIKRAFFNNVDTDKLKEVIKALSMGSTEDQKRASMLAHVLHNNFSVDDYNTYKSVFLTDKGTVRSRLATQKVISKQPLLLDFLRDEAERLLFTQNKLAALNVLLSTKAVLYIAQYIINKYNSYKKSYSVLDYEDLIFLTNKLLENQSVADWVLFKLDGGIDHILIDEAQDTSPAQWAIIRSLTQEFFSGLGAHEEGISRTVFVVGDRKQSIYSFQGADPREFDKMYHYFQERIQKFSKIHLDVSFRSTAAVMDCINTLFEAEEAKKGVIPVNEHINHRPFRLGEGGLVEILPLLKNESTEEKKDYNWILPVVQEKSPSLSNTLAKQIAQNIKDMVQSGDILTSRNRPVRYGDFMFLVQRRNAFVEEFVRACKDLGVNVSGVDKLKLLEQIAVQDLISLGRFLLLPMDDLSLAEALKSPLFGLNDDDLFNLCYKRSGSLFNSLLNNPAYQAVASELKILLNMSGYARPFELFNHIMVKMRKRSCFIARMGKEVEDILDEFLNLTLNFEQNHTPSLQSFITWIAQDEVIIKKEMEQGDSNAVKIMTVHGSKGLQAPIVILADTTHTKGVSQSCQFLWTEDMLYFPTSAEDYDDVCKKIKANQEDANTDEYRRLLYVALTRAEDRLYIAGYSSSEAKEESWYKLLEKNLSSNVTLADDDKRIVYKVEQKIPCSKNNIISVSNSSVKNYDYLLVPAPTENPLAKPYAPSHDEDEEDITDSPLKERCDFYKRGTVIHQLLQYITSINPEIIPDVAQSFLKQHLPEFSDSEHNKIIQEIINLYQSFPHIFTPSSMAEVPIIGEVDGKIISAKIDRLVVNDDSVIIVDYKTNRPAASSLDEVPARYIKQLATYKCLLEKIYPHKNIETYILWTNTCNLMKL